MVTWIYTFLRISNFLFLLLNKIFQTQIVCMYLPGIASKFIYAQCTLLNINFQWYCGLNQFE